MYSGIYLHRFESPQPRKLQSIAKQSLEKKRTVKAKRKEK